MNLEQKIEELKKPKFERTIIQQKHKVVDTNKRRYNRQEEKLRFKKDEEI